MPALILCGAFPFFFATRTQAAGPTISSLSVTSGPVGTSVTITGSSFGSNQGSSTVKFNGTTATATSWSATSIATTVPTGATTGNVVVTVSNKASNGVNFIVTPHITSLSLTSGAVGASVTITGTTFGSTQGLSTVKFNGTAGTPTSWSPTSIVLPVPTGATTGNVVVTVSSQVSNGVNFTVVPAPSISSLSPTSGAFGASVTIAGSNFGSTQGNGTVSFNGSASTPTSWSATTIVAPASSWTTGNVIVHASGVDSNGVTFTVVPAPSISALSPTSGAVGASVTITGSNFGSTQGNGTVSFNGTASTPTSWSATSIVVPVPSGATTGNVVVHASGVNSNGVGFTVLPTPNITNLSPAPGAVGAWITITGTGFGATQGTGTVAFNGTAGTPKTWSATSIVVPVPTGATTGNVVVNTSGVASNGVNFTVVPAPSITSLSPTTGAVGVSVTITGTNFGASQGTSTLSFNGTSATPTSWSATSIAVAVPTGATTGNVVVYAAGVASNGVTFTVNNVGTLSGSVTKATDGTPINGATIQTLQGGVVEGSASSAADGTYSIANLTAGSYDIKFSATGYGTAVSPGVSVTAGGTSSLNTSLSAPGTVAGQVTQSGGTPGISGATVTIYQGIESVGAATTDTNGNYSVPGLSPASYRVEATATGYLAQDQTGVTVTSGNTTTKNFSLSASGTAAVSYVYDELGRLVGAVDPSGNAAGYGFDPVGNLLSISRSAAGQVSILNFSPKSGSVGTTVTITGTSFSATSSQDAVSFNGTSASVSSATTSQIIVTVPTGATTGPIQVTAPTGTFTTATNFTLTTSNGAPTITSFTPAIATAGTSVTATGTNFDPLPANDRLKLNTTIQAVGSATATSFAANVPANTASGRLTLATTGGTGQSSQDLFIPFGAHVASDVGFTGRTTITGTQAISLGTASKIGLLVFDATAGQNVSALLSGSTFSSCTLYLYSPTGTQVGYGGCTSATTFFDTATLPATGTYTFGLEPNGTMGSITLGLNNPTTITGTITPGGSAVPETTTIPGQDVKLTFSGAANQRVSLFVDNVTNPYALLYLVKPDGTTQVTSSISNGNNTFMDVQTLATTGTYTLWVQHSGTGVGNERLQLYDVPPDVTASATIGGPTVPISTTKPGQNAYVTFSGTSGHNVTVNLTSGTYPNAGCNITLTDPNGAGVWANTCYGDTNTIGPTTLGSTGTFTLFINPQGTATGGLTVQLTGN